MKICILDDADPDSIDIQFPYAPEHYLNGHTWEKILLRKETAVIQIKELVSKDFDVVLNLCDGAWGEDRPGVEVVQALEMLDMAFTGADQHFFEPTREAMKMVCEVNHLGFPRGIQVTNIANVSDVVGHLKFPLLVKHPNSYASVALTPESKVTNESELRIQVARMLKLFSGCLVEEFIEGKEYSVLVAENPDDYEHPVVFTPIEVVFADGETFKHESLKWVDYNKISTKEVTDKELRKALEDMSQKVFSGLHGTGYGRCDIRSDADGNLYLLEINPNGAVLYPPEDPGTADHILALDSRGHELFIDLILRSAIVQRDNRRKGWKIQYHPDDGFGLYATRNFKVDEVVVSFEDLPHRLVSAPRIDKFSKAEQEKFFASAFHLTKDLFYAPAKYPEEWYPVSHSCKPTLWFAENSLQLIARRKIKQGERLTVDYAMLFTEELPSFDCHCCSENCRKVITGSDYKLSKKLYGGHNSPFIENIV